MKYEGKNIKKVRIEERLTTAEVKKDTKKERKQGLKGKTRKTVKRKGSRK